jgi:hypothetical protein
VLSKNHLKKHPMTGEKIEHAQQRIWERYTVDGRYCMMVSCSKTRIGNLKRKPGRIWDAHSFSKVAARVSESSVGSPALDPIRSGFEYLMLALKKFIFKNEYIHEELKRHDDFEGFKIMLKRGKASAFTKYCLCSKERRPDLKKPDKSEVPKICSFDCAFEKCVVRGVKKKDIVVSHPTLASCLKEVKVMVWKDADRSGGKKQRELTPVMMTIQEVVSKMADTAPALISHVARIQWTRHTIELDIARLGDD